METRAKPRLRVLMCTAIGALVGLFALCFLMWFVAVWEKALVVAGMAGIGYCIGRGLYDREA